MKFEKEFLQDLVYDDAVDAEIILDEVVDNSRWSIQHKMIFKYQEKYYETFYSVGATGMQCEEAYEYSGPEIHCTEVIQKVKLVKVWVEVENES